jgi:DNA-binding CsgD family transcriptional regulator
MLVPNGDANDLFRAAIIAHGRGPEPLDAARTELCFGESLRRRGRRREAREHLRTSLETFERQGASLWVERARSELKATGEKLDRHGVAVQQRLTPQELQIALAVSEGKTNREVGGQLFLSPKTVEFHLSSVYRKLGVGSRAELTRLLVDEAGAPGGRAHVS